jgi:hypothetical protein
MDGKNLNDLQKIVHLVRRVFFYCAWKRYALLLPFAFSFFAVAKPPPRNEKLWEVSRNMEKLFMRQMLQSMRQAVPSYSAVSQSGEFKIYQGMLDEEYANLIGDRGELGIASMVYDYFDPNASQGVKHEHEN